MLDKTSVSAHAGDGFLKTRIVRSGLQFGYFFSYACGIPDVGLLIPAYLPREMPVFAI
jgi:hypothetical protein